MSILSLAITPLLHHYLQSTANNFVVFLSDWPVSYSFILLTLLFTLIIATLARLGGFRFSDIYSVTSIKYPPIWFAVISGVSLFIYINKDRLVNINSINTESSFWILVSFFFGILLVQCLTWLSVTEIHQIIEHDIKTQKAIASNILDNPEALFSWIGREEPIVFEQQDLFNIYPIASRIASFFFDNKLISVGIVGPYGSGKSSLLNLLERKINYLYKTSSEQLEWSYIICRIDGWGRTKGSISQQILTKVIWMLKKVVDSTSVITVPANYREALSKDKSPFSLIASALISSDSDADAILHKIDKILIASDMRLIILLEDIDRNYSDDTVKDEMPALLDRLGKLRNISYVLAVSTEHHYSQTLVRICNHIETLT
ncbi:MAG: KAP family NTPase [Gammaproteobacteria bacterium]|nr:KAP family NTPase [Gammaproteobacteria bacterium]